MDNKLLPILSKKRGRPKVKATVKHVTLFLDGELLDKFDMQCKSNNEKSRTAVIEKLMRAYLCIEDNGQKQELIDTLEKLNKLLDQNGLQGITVNK